MKRYNERVARGMAEHGSEFDTADFQKVDREIVRAYCQETRVKVTGPYGTRTGTIGTTTGWRPAFLLMHRSNAHGSWDVLGSEDRVVAVWDGRKYRELIRS